MGANEAIREIADFESLLNYLRNELDWPIEADDVEDTYFDVEYDNLGIDEEVAAKINEIRQIRPMPGQPWGVFYVDFEPKHLPVVVLRRILRGVVTKRRASANQSDRATWNLEDLLFISSIGEEDCRGISFAHFKDTGEGVARLHTFSWDESETKLHSIRNVHLEHLRWPANTEDVNAWRAQWSKAFPVEHRYVIRTAQELSRTLAELAERTRARVMSVYVHEKKDGRLHGLHQVFQKVLIHDLPVEDFADMIAQTIAYGLFSARAAKEKPLSVDSLVEMIPATNPFLKSLMHVLVDAQGHGEDHLDFDELGISDIVAMLNAVKMLAVLGDFGRQTGGGQEDPVIHFYESFLKEYDAQRKVERGVFYTPKPVVSYIVRSVHEVLKRDFGVPLGLADTMTWREWLESQGRKRLPQACDKKIDLDSPFVQILDPATGTGTFLETVIEVIYAELTGHWKQENKSEAERQKLWNQYVPKHLLPRLNGFELMMAPYAVAHMKLGLVLKETGYDFSSGARLRVFLTNTLEEPHQYSEGLFAHLVADEVNEASRVKAETPITVIVGNPPYSRSSHNSNVWIDRLMEDYKKSVREEESQIQGLSNDYIKFMRFAQYQTQMTGTGVIGLITGHGFIKGPQARDMRGSLVSDYTQYAVLDTHGSVRRSSGLLGVGAVDDPLFQIQQGTAISIAYRTVTRSGSALLRHADLVGELATKYSFLQQKSLYSTVWRELAPEGPNWRFHHIESDVLALEEEYDTYPDLTRAFGTGDRSSDKEHRWATGCATQQDDFAVAFNKSELFQNVRCLIESDSKVDLANSFRLCKTNQWDYERAKSELAETDWSIKITDYLYRPFDIRYTVFDRNVATILRREVMANLLKGGALGVAVSRVINDDHFAHIIACNRPVDKILLSSKSSTNAYVFPLYLYPDSGEKRSLFDAAETSPWPPGPDGRVPNLDKAFVGGVAARLGLSFVSDGTGDLAETFGPEDLFHYIYAVFHSPTYRERYAEFLKIDFPRLPVTDDTDLFHALCALGSQLVPLHLMEADLTPITTFPVSGDNAVTKVGEKKKTLADVEDGVGKLYINHDQYFGNLPVAVWDFHIGGYQVCHKWLADRKKAGRTLTTDDIKHYHYIVAALARTMQIMTEIDDAIQAHGGWPLAGSQVSINSTSDGSSQEITQEIDEPSCNDLPSSSSKNAYSVIAIIDGRLESLEAFPLTKDGFKLAKAAFSEKLAQYNVNIKPQPETDCWWENTESRMMCSINIVTSSIKCTDNLVDSELISLIAYSDDPYFYCKGSDGNLEYCGKDPDGYYQYSPDDLVPPYDVRLIIHLPRTQSNQGYARKWFLDNVKEIYVNQIVFGTLQKYGIEVFDDEAYQEMAQSHIEECIKPDDWFWAEENPYLGPPGELVEYYAVYPYCSSM